MGALQRAPPSRQGAQADAGPLRSRIPGHLGRLRAALADLASVDPSLPSDLDQQLFGYLDTLAAQRAGTPQGAAASAATPTQPATPEA